MIISFLIACYVAFSSNYIVYWLKTGSYMKNSFPKRVKRQPKNRCCNANVKFGDHVLEKSSSYIYIYIYAYKKPFNEAQSLKLALALQDTFLEWRLTRFEKELFTCRIVLWPMPKRNTDNFHTTRNLRCCQEAKLHQPTYQPVFCALAHVSCQWGWTNPR